MLKKIWKVFWDSIEGYLIVTAVITSITFIVLTAIAYFTGEVPKASLSEQYTRINTIGLILCIIAGYVYLVLKVRANKTEPSLTIYAVYETVGEKRSLLEVFTSYNEVVEYCSTERPPTDFSSGLRDVTNSRQLSYQELLLTEKK